MTYSRASELPPDVRLEYPYAGNLFEQPGGVSMHYLDEGIGPVVLLLHGNPTWSFYFRNLINELVTAGFRCVAPDHIGCGLSDKPQVYDYTLKRRIGDVERLLDHLGIRRFHLVVHDWGGAIGCGLAGRRPEALEKLVLLNTAAFRSKRIPLRIALLKLPLLGPFLIRGLNAFAGPAVNMSVVRPLTKRVRRGMLWPYRTWAQRVAIWNFVKDIPLGPSHRSYSELSAVEECLTRLEGKPVLLAWGGRDFCFNDHFYRRWQAILPKAETAYHDDCGHYILEDGGLKLWEELRIFLMR